MKLLMTRGLGEKYTNAIKNLGYEILYLSEKDMKNLGKEGIRNSKEAHNIYGADVLFTFKGFDYLDLNEMKELKYIHLTSTGIDRIPADTILEKGLYLSNNPIGYAVPMAESIVTYILELYKNSPKMFRNQRDKVWRQDLDWLELTGKTVGFLGTGNIAQEAIKRLKAFGTTHWGVNTNGRLIDGFERCFSVNDMEEFFRGCDVVVGIMPDTEKTRGLINAKYFELMKEGSLFINIGRGSLINQSDLEKYVDKFKGVALDVFEKEPLPKESKLWDCDNVIVTPHNAWVSEKVVERLGEVVVENLEHFIKYGKPKYYVKDLKKGY